VPFLQAKADKPEIGVDGTSISSSLMDAVTIATVVVILLNEMHLCVIRLQFSIHLRKSLKASSQSKFQQMADCIVIVGQSLCTIKSADQ
jgi:hypothetical protein